MKKSDGSWWGKARLALRPWMARRARIPTRFDNPAGALHGDLFPVKTSESAEALFASAVREIAVDLDYPFSARRGWRARVWFEGEPEWVSVFVESLPEEAYGVARWQAKHGVSICKIGGGLAWVAASAERARLTPWPECFKGDLPQKYYFNWIFGLMCANAALRERFYASAQAQALRAARFPEELRARAAVIEEAEDLERSALGGKAGASPARRL